MTAVFLKGDSCVRGLRPAFAIHFKRASTIDAVLHPRGCAKRDTLFPLIANYLHLCNLRIGKVNTQIFDGAVCRADHRKGQHSAVTKKFGATSVNGEILPAFQPNPCALRLVLVVVGYVHFTLCRIGGVELPYSFLRQENHYLVIRIDCAVDAIQYNSEARTEQTLTVGLFQTIFRFGQIYFHLAGGERCEN